MPPLTRLHCVIKGRVQGIGYRWYARLSAERLGVAGWVRNRTDGSVEAEAEGDAKSLGEFVSALRAGPPGARVEAVETKTLAAKGDKTFEIR